ncbi:MAG: PTS fructose transporter subunit IIA [Hyphomicrobiales bacterium]|nr:MAG: PTS fructose transporter subunit IIA [Hyphomicrobiales bacterium]
MIGLVLVTHGGLAKEFQLALEHVVGPQVQMETVSIGPDDDMERRRQDILDCVSRVNKGKGAIILTDMFGGTPSNLSISIMEPGLIEVVAGVNLPMLIKLAGIRSNDNMQEALEKAMESGKRYINVASQVLAGQ